MKTIGMIGSHLIHTYGYGMHLNPFDLEFACRAKTVPKWQLQLMEGNPGVTPLGGGALTHIWGGLEGVPEDMAGTFGLTVAACKEEVFEACDLVMVMDEQIASRSALIACALDAGKPVFVDKLPSDSFAATEELTQRADAAGVAFAGWSQMAFCPELLAVRDMPQGGLAYVNFRMTMDILPKYGIHAISPVQRCFPGVISEIRLIEDGEQRLVYMENETGTKIVLGVGPQFPAGMVRVDYSVDGRSCHVDGSDLCGAFRGAAEQIVAMSSGETPALGRQEMLQASRILEKITGCRA